MFRPLPESSLGVHDYLVSDFGLRHKCDTKKSRTPEDDLCKGRNMYGRYQQQNKADVDTTVSILFVF
jgi:hypothetical protein